MHSGLRVGLLGLDHPHARLLLQTFENLPEVTAVQVWDESAARLRGFDRTAYRKVESTTVRLDALLASPELAAVIICAPTAEMPRLARRALAAGKHVLCDKPLALDPRTVEQLHALAELRELACSVLYGQRAHPAVLRARRIVSAGTLGRILSVEGRLVTTQVRFREPRHWIFSRRQSGGGVIAWLGCHYLDLFQFILGEKIVAATAVVARRSRENIDVEDVAALALELEDGAVATLHCAYGLAHAGAGYANRGGFDCRLAIHGEHGRIVWGGVPKPAMLVEFTDPAGRLIRQTLRFRQRKTNSYGGATGERFVREFLRSLDCPANAPSPAGDAAEVARVIAAIYRSVETRQLERVNARSNHRRSRAPRR